MIWVKKWLSHALDSDSVSVLLMKQKRWGVQVSSRQAVC